MHPYIVIINIILIGIFDRKTVVVIVDNPILIRVWLTRSTHTIIIGVGLVMFGVFGHHRHRLPRPDRRRAEWD